MEAHNHFTCIAYDTIDFLIQSKYVIFGIYLSVEKDVKSIIFNRETLPHIHIGSLLEKEFECRPLENCTVVLVMKKHNFESDVQRLIVDYTQTAFPASGNLAISVNCSVASKIIDIKNLHLIPPGIRARQTECGVCAIGFLDDEKDKKLLRKQILISPDNLLRKFFSAGLIKIK
ncbi:hypothetical protein [Treponema sp.]|uniref:hypothetical protein n=1 Tax=Treponema sp. TaxID=166 RepID=UPI00388F86A5